MRALLDQLKRPGRTYAAVFGAAVLVTLVFRAVLPAGYRVNENSDYIALYSPVAHNILAGRGITIGTGVPAVMTPPGYPLILAGVLGLSGVLRLPEGVGILALACLAMGVCSVLVYVVARSMWGAVPALVAPVLWMTYPFVLWLTKQPNSEIPFLIAYYGAFGLFWSSVTQRAGGSYRRYALTGILVGGAALIRPIAIGLGVAFAAVLWLTRRDLAPRLRLGLVTALLVGNLAAVFPWEAWVYRQTGRAVLLGTVGAVSMRDGLVFAHPLEYRTWITVPAGVKLVMEDAWARSKELNSSRDMLRFLAGEFRERPMAVGELLALKVARSWYGTDSGRHEGVILLIQALYVPVALWASFVAWRQGGRSRQLAVSVAVTVVYFWAMVTLVVPLLRYMVPAVGLLFVLLPVLLVRARAGAPTVLASATADLRA